MHKSVNFEELISLYAVSDVCLVSSTRDGMNLVSYEYIATQQKRHGVMILSEFTGAAQSLNGSIVVNPWNTEELANAIHEAITLPPDLREAYHKKLYEYVTKYTRYIIDPRLLLLFGFLFYFLILTNVKVRFGGSLSLASLLPSRIKLRSQ